MKIEDRGLICDVTKRPVSERCACFTSLCPASSGSILAAFELGAAKRAANSNILICRSKDQGRNWRDLPVRFEVKFEGVSGSVDVGEIVETEPGRLLFVGTWYDRSNPNWSKYPESMAHNKQLAAFSDDDGESWSAWRQVSVHELEGISCSTGPILKWADGTIAYPFESYQEVDRPVPEFTHGAWMTVSKDRGRSFGKPLLVAQHPEHSKIFYWDQRLCVGRKNGEFIALFWTHDLERKKDLNVHLRKGVLSENGIEYDGPVIDTKIPGQIAAPLLLDDGRLLAFVVDRGEKCTMKLWQSEDGGTNWSEKLVVYNHSELGAVTQGKENINYVTYYDDMTKWTFGHPAIRSLGNRRLLLAHYAGAPNFLSMHWVRIEID